MTDRLVLDSCLLPQKAMRISANPLLAALIQIARARGFEVAIVDVTYWESLAERRRAAADAETRLRTAIKTANEVGYELDVYIPSSDDIVDAWDGELKATFVILETVGEDARDALKREANRTAPARATSGGSATGARDAAIWLSVTRLHNEGAGKTVFVTGNTKDFFADSGIKSTLLADIAVRQEEFSAYPSLSLAVESLATRVELRPLAVLDHPWVAAAIRDAVEVGLENHDRFRRAVVEAGSGQISIERLTEQSAFGVGENRLARVEAAFTYAPTPAAETSDGSELTPTETPIMWSGTVRCWVLESDGGATVDVERLTVAGPDAATASGA